VRWILQKLLGLDPSVLKEGATIRLDLARNWPLWIILLVMVGFVVYAAILYRKENRPATARMKLLLTSLRAVVLGLLLFLLCEPVLAAVETKFTQPYVVFMIDTSQSMDLKDRYPDQEDIDHVRAALPGDFVIDGTPLADMKQTDFQKLSRLDLINAVMNGKKTDPRKSKLAKRYKLRFYEFASDITPKSYKDSETESDPKTTGAESAEIKKEKKVLPIVIAGSSKSGGSGSGETRLGDCMRTVLSDMRGKTVAAIVLMTDGRSNAGRDPLDVARKAGLRNIPIFAVGVGDRKIRDIEVTRIDAPDRTRAGGDDVSFITTLNARGCAGQSVEVILKKGNEKIHSEKVLFEKDGPRIVELRDRPDVIGKAVYTVEVRPLSGELVTDNNSRTHILSVVEGKTRVLYVEGGDRARWEYRFLKAAMMRDHTLQVTTLLAKANGDFFYDGNYRAEAYPDTEKGLFDKYDVIIFGDVDPETFTKGQLELTARFVENGGGFMMIAGEIFAPASYIKTPIRPLIPVKIDESDEAFLEMGRVIVTAFKPDVTSAGWQSSILRLDNEDRINRDLWNKTPEEGGLAPLFWYMPVSKALPTATVLLRHPTDRARNAKQNRPMLVLGRYGSGMTLFSGSDELWRWRFAQGDRYFYRFYAQAIHYLASARGGGQKLSILSSDRPAYALGEAVSFTAEVKVLKGTKYVPLEQDSVELHYAVEGMGELTPVKLAKVPGSPGTYKGQMHPGSKGRFHAWIRSYDSARKRGGQCDFEVRFPQLEYEDPRMDKDALSAIAKAAASGGQFLFLDRVGDLDKLVTMPEVIKRMENRTPLWDNWRLFALFSVLIVAEWILRKRVRMM
jgi:uncharacterized membrane protein